jgi:RNA polymerase sigma-70 factor, ECF subfamily
MEALLREERGRLLAALLSWTRNFDLAEEALQEACLAALRVWPAHGEPERPGAWLLTTARHWLLDRMRVEGRRAELLRVANLPTHTAAEELTEEVAVPDYRLKLIFTCCHPALSVEARVALTLRTLGGLGTSEVAHAFLCSEATIAQRLVRAKRKIRDANIPYRVPEKSDLPERLPAVLSVLYLIFNQSYSPGGQAALATEAIRMIRILRQLMPEEPEITGLLALCLLQESRRAARLDTQGDIVVLPRQDRRLWHQPSIAEAQKLLPLALQPPAGPYALQAAIAAVHAESPADELTDWGQIAALYQQLYRVWPSPVVQLNRAIAVNKVAGPQAAIDLLFPIAEALDHYSLFHATLAELHLLLANRDAAEQCFRRALELSESAVERRHLERRLQSSH